MEKLDRLHQRDINDMGQVDYTVIVNIIDKINEIIEAVNKKTS